ncbi:hypothetical protein [Streptomyces erythrochromogenes]|uniref:hypothetical protein n=1 Tax=Streptomyces erythrochromogenes TaxID=285574 RepID=UPI00386973FB|nr:hypothetical protein OG364_33110 [Streptomyces erythrochromogenes]
MSPPPAYDVLTALVVLACLAQITALAILRWGRLTCPHCDLTIRFEGVKRDEALRLQRHMNTHIASHDAEGADQ